MPPQLDAPNPPASRVIPRDPIVIVNRPAAAPTAERSCGYPGCAVRLSRYNPNPTCASHGGWEDPAGAPTPR